MIIKAFFKNLPLEKYRGNSMAKNSQYKITPLFRRVKENQDPKLQERIKEVTVSDSTKEIINLNRVVTGDNDELFLYKDIPIKLINLNEKIDDDDDIVGEGTICTNHEDLILKGK